MERDVRLKEEYINALNERINEHKKKIEFLKREDLNDESNLEKIKANVIDIFLKMFKVSYNNIYGELKNENIKKAINPTDDNYTKLYSAYMLFFNMIPAPWIEKAKKTKTLNMTEQHIIEELKINTVNEVKEIFVEFYNKF